MNAAIKGMTQNPAVSTVLAELIDMLDPEQLAGLQAHVEHKTTQNQKFSKDEFLVWEALCAALVNPWPNKLEHFCEGFGIRKYKNTVSYICGLVLTAKAPTLRTPRLMLVTLAFDCLIEYMPARCPRTPKTVLQMVGYLPQALDRAYPGYLGAGLLYKVVRTAA